MGREDADFVGLFDGTKELIRVGVLELDRNDGIEVNKLDGFRLGSVDEGDDEVGLGDSILLVGLLVCLMEGELLGLIVGELVGDSVVGDPLGKCVGFLLFEA